MQNDEQLRREHALSDREIPWNHNVVMRTLHDIDQNVRRTRYTAVTHVSEKDGIYEFDCSGMAGWVLRKATPIAYGQTTVYAQRPLARDFHQAISKASTESVRGWRRIERVEDMEPGDVIAWIKPAVLKRSVNTGHVAFAVRKAYALPSGEGYLVRIVDATSLLHEADTREPDGSGFGRGTIMVLADSDGRPAGYSWVGDRAHRFVTQVVVGRALR